MERCKEYIKEHKYTREKIKLINECERGEK
jgi:hypothetical protein